MRGWRWRRLRRRRRKRKGKVDFLCSDGWDVKKVFFFVAQLKTREKENLASCRSKSYNIVSHDYAEKKKPFFGGPFFCLAIFPLCHHGWFTDFSFLLLVPLRSRTAVSRKKANNNSPPFPWQTSLGKRRLATRKKVGEFFPHPFKQRTLYHLFTLQR